MAQPAVHNFKMVHRVKLVSNLILLASIAASPAFAFNPSTQIKSLASKNVRGSHSQHVVRRSDTAVYGSIIKQRLTFNSPPGQYGKELPKLILISGCPGTGEREHYRFSLLVSRLFHKRQHTQCVSAKLIVPRQVNVWHVIGVGARHFKMHIDRYRLVLLR